VRIVGTVEGSKIEAAESSYIGYAEALLVLNGAFRDVYLTDDTRPIFDESFGEVMAHVAALQDAMIRPFAAGSGRRKTKKLRHRI